MRTTVEITSAQRARLLALAARRGDKGFSRLVQEALDAYLGAVAGEEAKRRNGEGRIRGCYVDVTQAVMNLRQDLLRTGRRGIDRGKRKMRWQNA